jgi:hypothetical protein
MKRSVLIQTRIFHSFYHHPKTRTCLCFQTKPQTLSLHALQGRTNRLSAVQGTAEAASVELSRRVGRSKF